MQHAEHRARRKSQLTTSNGDRNFRRTLGLLSPGIRSQNEPSPFPRWDSRISSAGSLIPPSGLSPHTGLPDIDYPFHDKTIVVTRCGRICLGNKKINFSQVFAGQAVGIKEVHDDIWLVSFMDYDLGYFDLETRVLEPLENPFGPKLLPM